MNRETILARLASARQLIESVPSGERNSLWIEHVAPLSAGVDQDDVEWFEDRTSDLCADVGLDFTGADGHRYLAANGMYEFDGLDRFPGPYPRYLMFDVTAESADKLLELERVGGGYRSWTWGAMPEESRVWFADARKGATDEMLRPGLDRFYVDLAARGIRIRYASALLLRDAAVLVDRSELIARLASFRLALIAAGDRVWERWNSAIEPVLNVAGSRDSEWLADRIDDLGAEFRIPGFYRAADTRRLASEGRLQEGEPPNDNEQLPYFKSFQVESRQSSHPTPLAAALAELAAGGGEGPWTWGYVPSDKYGWFSDARPGATLAEIDAGLDVLRTELRRLGLEFVPD